MFIVSLSKWSLTFKIIPGVPPRIDLILLVLICRVTPNNYKVVGRAGVKYVLSNTNTNTLFLRVSNTNTNLYKYTGENLIKYKYKYSPSNTNTNTNTHWGRDKIAAILQMTYSNSLYCKKIVSNFTENCFQRSNLPQASIGSDNGLALSRQQAIIWPMMAQLTDA